MPNLLVEYLNRHKSVSVPVCHNGVCFFTQNENPALVALTSLACRTFSTCQECGNVANNGNIAVELFVPGWNGSFYQVLHKHVNPNTDLLTVVDNHTTENLIGGMKPFMAKTTKELDIWLWKFISQQTPMKFYKPSAQAEKDENLKQIESMTFAAFGQPNTYKSYYIAHEALLLNRKYMLLNA